MIKQYTKDGKIRAFNVEDGRVMATIELGGVWVSNPSLADFLADGWREWIAPIPEPYIPTYSELVEEYIRENGYPTYGAELAVLNNYASDPTTYAEQYANYMATRVAAKEWANEQPHRDE